MDLRNQKIKVLRMGHSGIKNPHPSNNSKRGHAMKVNPNIITSIIITGILITLIFNIYTDRMQTQTMQTMNQIDELQYQQLKSMSERINVLYKENAEQQTQISLLKYKIDILKENENNETPMPK